MKILTAQFWTKRKIVAFLLILVSLRVFLLFQLDRHTYWTFDEPWNTNTAKQVIDEGQFRRTKDSFTPISIVNVYVGLKLMKIWPNLDRLTADRVAGIVLNQASVPLTYRLGVELGAAAPEALIFTAFMGLEPNLLGHTLLASNVDGYIYTWFLLLAVVAFIWARKPTWHNLAHFGLVLGLAQGVKLTSAYALPICLAWLAYVFWKKKYKHAAASLFFFLVISWFGLCVIYAFNKIGTPFSDIHFVSQPFQKLAAKLGRLPAIIPVDYLQGLDMCLQTDTTPRPVYIRNTFLLHGVWYYFLYVLLLKTPLPLMIPAAGGWIAQLIKSARKKTFAEPKVFVTLFVVVMMVYFSFFFNAQIGMRYLFPIYGFLLVGMIWFPWKPALLTLAALWFAATSVYNWPNEIGYFNELVPVKHHRWWHLGDSNLTWNQEWKDWPVFIGENHLPYEIIGPPTFPIDTPFYEDAITVAGILSNRQQLEVLRDNFEPFASFEGVKLKYLVKSSEVLAHFPPVGAESSAEVASLSPLPARACPNPGWNDETGSLISANDVLSHSVPPGQHRFTSEFTVFEGAPVFIELASKDESTLNINGVRILFASPPSPRLVVRTVKLKAGRYLAEALYTKRWNDGFISVRAFQFDPTGQKATPIVFCAEKAVQ